MQIPCRMVRAKFLSKSSPTVRQKWRTLRSLCWPDGIFQAFFFFNLSFPSCFHTGLPTNWHQMQNSSNTLSSPTLLRSRMSGQQQLLWTQKGVDSKSQVLNFALWSWQLVFSLCYKVGNRKIPWWISALQARVGPLRTERRVGKMPAYMASVQVAQDATKKTDFPQHCSGRTPRNMSISLLSICSIRLVTVPARLRWEGTGTTKDNKNEECICAANKMGSCVEGLTHPQSFMEIGCHSFFCFVLFCFDYSHHTSCFSFI